MKGQEDVVNQYMVTGDVFFNNGKTLLCSVQREIWAETPNAAKMYFENSQRGHGMTVKNVKVSKIKTQP